MLSFSLFREKSCFTRRIHFQSLVLFADVDRRQFGLWNGCGVICEHHHGVNVNVVVVLWGSGRSPYLCCKNKSQNTIKMMIRTRNTKLAMKRLHIRQHQVKWLTGMISVWPSSPSKTYSCISVHRISVHKKSITTCYLTRRDCSSHSPCCKHPLWYKWKVRHLCAWTAGRRPPSAFATVAAPSPASSIQAAPVKRVKLFNTSGQEPKKIILCVFNSIPSGQFHHHWHGGIPNNARHIFRLVWAVG